MKQPKIPQTRRKFIYRTIKRNNGTGSVKDRVRSGRPVSVTTVRMKNPRRSMRKMASELGISRFSVQKIVYCIN